MQTLSLFSHPEPSDDEPGDLRLTHLPPLREQPGTRVTYAPQACTTYEIVAALIGGTAAGPAAAALLTRYYTLHGIARCNLHELKAIKGLGETAAARMLAAFEIGRRLAVPEEDRPTLASPGDAAQLLYPLLCHKEQEYLYVILLDTRNRLIGPPREIYHGSLNTSMIRVGELFREAIRANAAAIIIAHNHPSGDPGPSPEDVAVTRAVVDAGKLLDISVLDHLVIGHYRHVSLKERGLGFSG